MHKYMDAGGDDLPGMWEEADLTGGETDMPPAELPQEPSTPGQGTSGRVDSQPASTAVPGGSRELLDFGELRLTFNEKDLFLEDKEGRVDCMLLAVDVSMLKEILHKWEDGEDL
jgi:hypothetical protein